MARITTAIPSNNFELIRDRLGVILALELDNQATLNNNNDLRADVFVERNTPIDKVEVPTINISLAEGLYDNKHQANSRGTYTFNIDCYTSAKSTNNQQGDVLSMIKLHRLIGVCRAILENPIYKTLDFQPPFISTSLSKSISIRANTTHDAANTSMGRLSYEVKCVEETSLLTAPLVCEFYTKVLLDLSDEGYVYYGKKMGSFNSSFNNSYSRT